MNIKRIFGPIDPGLEDTLDQKKRQESGSRETK